MWHHVRERRGHFLKRCWHPMVARRSRRRNRRQRLGDGGAVGVDRSACLTRYEERSPALVSLSRLLPPFHPFQRRRVRGEARQLTACGPLVILCLARVAQTPAGPTPGREAFDRYVDTRRSTLAVRTSEKQAPEPPDAVRSHFGFDGPRGSPRAVRLPGQRIVPTRANLSPLFDQASVDHLGFECGGALTDAHSSPAASAARRHRHAARHVKRSVTSSWLHASSPDVEGVRTGPSGKADVTHLACAAVRRENGSLRRDETEGAMC
jgi:hypothetical protein